MSKYVFLTPGIRGIGGAQLYISHKIEWLEKIGWSVDVFYYYSGDILIDNLKRFQSNKLDLLQVPPISLTHTKRDSIISAMQNGQKDLFIETHTVGLSLWGEFLASVSDSKHLCYLLTEQYPKITPSVYDMLLFKYKHNQLRGISSTSICKLLTNDDIDGGATFLSAVGCTNSVSNVDSTNISPIDRTIRYDHHILSLGRLDKPYILPMINAVIRYADRIFPKRILFSIVGTADEAKLFRIKSLLSGPTNLDVAYYGALFPIPKSVFCDVDLCLASAGCVTTCSSQGIPTIVVDAADFYAIGVYNITTTKCLFRDTEPPIDIDVLIYDVLDENTDRYRVCNETIIEKDYRYHDELMSIVQKEYYPVNTISKSFRNRVIYLVFLILGEHVGIKVMKKLYSLIS